MSPNNDGARRSDLMHPIVYRVVLALAVLLVLAAWWGFAGPGYQGLVLVVVSLLVFATVTLSLLLRRIARARGGSGEAPALRRWLDGDFVTQTGREPARDAVVGLLLPIVAVSVGMLVFAIVLHVAVPGA